MRNKKTHKRILYLIKPRKKKRKSNNSAFIRFLETLVIINTPLLNRIIELNNSNDDLDYNVIVTYAWEEPTPRLTITAMEPQSGNYLIIKIKFYQQNHSYNIKVLLDNGSSIPLFFLLKA